MARGQSQAEELAPAARMEALLLIVLAETLAAARTEILGAARAETLAVARVETLATTWAEALWAVRQLGRES